MSNGRTVASADGVRIAFDVSGDGPPLVLINGALSDRSSAGQLRGCLDRHFTTYAYDRRGRGESGDGAVADPRAEIEDLAAVLVVAGSDSFVFGRSSGGLLALEAAMDGIPVQALAVYEPPYIVPGTRPLPTIDLADRLAELLSEGEADAAVRLFLDEAVAVPEPVIDDLESGAGWPRMVGMARSLVSDAALVGQGSMPIHRLRTLRLPVLVMAGGDSPSWLRQSAMALAAAIPHATRVELPGQTHQATPEAIAGQLSQFFFCGSLVAG